ncbi:unnamed protein product [Hymenolepis diminuta]|uniref:Uncharacterized protein n=1 Tax=Hymenolepis diminuta TaxID=6216 RepID=A0A564YEI5_HYMDI|nr:unnamed protein product [Hymenolepis diminuta]
MLRPVLRSKVPSIKTRAKLPEVFTEPVLLYNLSAIIFDKDDNNKLKTVQSTTRRMVLGYYSRR